MLGSMRAEGLGTCALAGVVGAHCDSDCFASGFRRSNCTVPVGDFAGVEAGIGDGTSWGRWGEEAGFASSMGGTSRSVMEAVEVDVTSTSSGESTDPSSCSYTHIR
jgi:hypothetical protein